MGLYLLVEKRLKGQRLGNVGLNIDEKQKERREKRMGLKLRPAARVRAAVFFQTLKEGKKI